MISNLGDSDLLLGQLLVGLIRAIQFERVGNGSFPFLHARDHVGAAEPVGFGEIGRRPAGWMVGMGMVEADDILAALAAFALDVDQFARIDVVAVLRRIGARVSAARGGSHDARAIVVHATKQDTAALMRVGLFAVAANGCVVLQAEF